jgi:hypothetical protein
MGARQLTAAVSRAAGIELFERFELLTPQLVCRRESFGYG